MAKQKFIVVSNRLPVSVTKSGGELLFTPSSGGLATAMASLGNKDQLWIGWPGISADELSRREKTTIIRKLKEYGCYPVFLTTSQIDAFYNGYANDTLWPLFHYFQSFAQYNDTYWKAYQEVSAIFHEAVVQHAHPKTTVWVHDYHLMLLPAQLRHTLPESTIGFFLHIPFPSYEIFRSLPNRREILEGLLGADLIGFHTYDYARHFLSSVLRILGIENNHGIAVTDDRVVKIDAFPIGIDYKKFTDSLSSKGAATEIKKVAEHYQDQQIILSVDRLDYSKGIPKRLEAYEQLLKDYPKYRKKVVLVMVAVPSRTEVGIYKELRDTIEKSISRINGTFGTIDWIPISYQFQNLPFEQIVALYASADVALVTPLRDGMNLVAKEYVAAKQGRTGVLILSEMAGAVDELPEALRVNPNDINSIKDALQMALTMPEKDQAERLESMQNRLSKYTVQRWAFDFLEQLSQARQPRAQNGSKFLAPKTEQAIVRSFVRAKKRLILLDYDGTLQNFVPTPNPDQAAPSPSLKALIKGLVTLPHTKVAIISGRSKNALESWFGDIPVSLAAEHGAWIKSEAGWTRQQVSFGDHREAIVSVLEHYADRTPGARIEQKDFSIVWHYRNVPPELAFARSVGLRHDLKQLLSDTEIGLYNGSKVIEIKPRGIHKGAICKELLAANPSDLILCIGDDYTDEDMFRALPKTAYTIQVGLDDTAARFRIESVEKVLRLLQKMLRGAKQ